MKPSIWQELNKRNGKISRRLKKVAPADDSGLPVFGRQKPKHEISKRIQVTAHGSIGAAHQVVVKSGLVDGFESGLEILKIYRPYHESDHILNIAYNALCGGQTLDDILLRGDTDFSQTQHLDRWTKSGVRFVFGYDAFPNLKKMVQNVPDRQYKELERRAKRAFVELDKRRDRPARIKESIVRDRKYKNIRLLSEDISEFDYRPTGCDQTYRMVALRKNLSVEKGEEVLFEDVRYFFYITNDREMAVEQTGERE